MDLWLPALRADITIDETYRYVEEPPLDCPISCFGGLNDSSTTVRHLAAWREQTSAAFTLNMLPGGHFFIHDAREALLRLVAEDLNRDRCAAYL